MAKKYLDETGLSQVWSKMKSTFATPSDIATALGTVYKIKGSRTTAQLPTTDEDRKQGDVWNLSDAGTYGPAGTNVVWTGTDWDPLAGTYSVFNSTTAGLVPVPGTENAGKFLKGDGTWAEVSLDGYATQTWVEGKGYLTSVTAHNQASNTITAMTGYSKPATTSAIADTDDLNTAIGKLEKALDNKGTSSLTLGTTHTTAAYGDHTHTDYVKSISVNNGTAVTPDEDGIANIEINTDVFTTTSNGLVPAPTAANLGKYLKSDGTWAEIDGIKTYENDPANRQKLNLARFNFSTVNSSDARFAGAMFLVTVRDNTDNNSSGILTVRYGAYSADNSSIRANYCNYAVLNSNKTQPSSVKFYVDTTDVNTPKLYCEFTKSGYNRVYITPVHNVKNFVWTQTEVTDIPTTNVLEVAQTTIGDNIPIDTVIPATPEDTHVLSTKAIDNIRKYGNYAHQFWGTNGAADYIHFCRLKTKVQWNDELCKFEISGRNIHGNVYFRLTGSGGTADANGYRPIIGPSVVYQSDNNEVSYLYWNQPDQYTLDLYWKKTQANEQYSITSIDIGAYARAGLEITWLDSQVATLPTDSTKADFRGVALADKAVNAVYHRNSDASNPGDITYINMMDESHSGLTLPGTGYWHVINNQWGGNDTSWPSQFAFPTSDSQTKNCYFRYSNNTAKYGSGWIQLANTVDTFSKKGIIIGTTDWNNLTEPGTYKVQCAGWGAAATYHGPNSYSATQYAYGLLNVFASNVSDEKRIMQIYYPHGGPTAADKQILFRMHNSNDMTAGWTAWAPIFANTWRGIQNNLTSDSTTESLSAAQGKALNDKFGSYVAKAGDTMTGPLKINPGAANNYTEGIRINQATDGWSLVNLGGAANSTDGAGGWLIARRGNNATDGSFGSAGDLVIQNGSSNGATGVTIRTDGFTCVRAGIAAQGSVRVGASSFGSNYVSGGCAMTYNSTDESLDFIF